MTLLRQALGAMHGMVFVVIFVFVSLLALVVLTVMPGVAARRRTVRLAARAVFTLSGTPLRVAGLEHVPGESAVVVANHASYLDGIILTAALPPRFAFVIKREMTRVPFAHYLLRRIGSEFVERFDTHRGAIDARRILQRAGARQSLAFFPEGTFGPEPGLRRFQHGAFVIAARNKLPVTPVIVRGSRAMLPAGRWLPRPGKIEVEIRPALMPGENGTARELADTARRQILLRLPEPDVSEPSAA